MTSRILGFVGFLAYVALAFTFKTWLSDKFRPANVPPPEKLTREQTLLMGAAFVLPVVIAMGFVFFASS